MYAERTEVHCMCQNTLFVKLQLARGITELSCGITGLFCGLIRLFCGIVRLFCRLTRLFCGVKVPFSETLIPTRHGVFVFLNMYTELYVDVYCTHNNK